MIVKINISINSETETIDINVSNTLDEHKTLDFLEKIVEKIKAKQKSQAQNYIIANFKGEKYK